ncbi:MAG: cytochrome c [Bacteroidales bacterium]|nr:cytochrome c [Bacteroidales bacterium]
MVLALVVILGACDRSRKHPGWDYFPDMAYSNAYETYSPNEIFKDGKTLQAPVEGTISRDAVLFAYGPSAEERTRAGRELSNPLEYTNPNLERGAEVYRTFCSSCHGDQGDGRGHLVTSGVYKYPVRTLVSDEMKERPDGEIYHSITLGFGVMGAHGFMIRPEDRWKVILYIRKQQKRNINEGSS